MKTPLLVLALALSGALTGCGVMVDNGPGGIIVDTTPAVVVDDGGYYDDGYSDWHHGGYDGGYYGSDDTVIVDHHNTTVVQQPTTVVVQQPTSVSTPASSGSVDPIIQSFTANPGNTVRSGQPITFTVVASDPNHQALQFNWSSTGGVLSTNTGRVVTWTPPVTPGIYTVSTIITNGKGGAVTGSQNMTVLADGSTSPSAVTTASVPAAQTTTTTTTATTTTQAPAAERQNPASRYGH